MFKLIEKIGDYYTLSSIQNQINIYNKQSKSLKKKTNKKHQEIYDRGCLYMDKTMKYPTVKPYNTVFKICDHVNVKDILNLFYTNKDLRNRSVVLRRPKIIDTYKTYVQSGGTNFKHVVKSDPRRYVLTNNEESYVIKIARHEDYSCAYEDEAKIYDALGNDKRDVVRKYGSGKVNDVLKLSINNNETVIHKDELKLNNIIENAQYIILENTIDYVDFYDYIDDFYDDRSDINSDKTNTIEHVLKVFHKIMETIKYYNTNCGFFHGDLQGHNVKVKVNGQEIKVKLFDFDFSGIIKNDTNNIISRNISLYNLKKEKKSIFSCKNQQSESLCDCKIEFNMESGINDVKRFMYEFDYFRLLLSTIIHLENMFENTNVKESVADMVKRNAPRNEGDKPIFNKIIKWYETNVIPEWRFCFKKDYFCTNIWETPPDSVELNKIQNVKQKMTQSEVKACLSRLRKERLKNPSSSDLSSTFSSVVSGDNK
jgi:hypothetical protein